MAFATLSKLPAIVWVTPVLIHTLMNLSEKRQAAKVLTATIVAIIPTMLWYFYWVPDLVAKYHYQLYFPKSIPEGISEIKEHIPGLLKNFYFHAFSSYIAFACSVAGLWLLVRKGTIRLKLAAAATAGVFSIFIIKTGSVFPLHNYYIIPIVPAMALLAGWALTELPSRVATIIIIGIIAESLLNQQHDFFIKENQLYKMELEKLTVAHIPKNERIIVNGGQSPQMMYLAHRKGWTLNNEQLLIPGTLDSIYNLGGIYLVIDKTNDMTAPVSAANIYEDDHFRIYRLQPQ